MQRLARRSDIMPDTVALIIWLIAGVAGGNAAGELLKGSYDLGPGNSVAGAIGGIVGAQILQTLVPGMGGFDFGPILGQVIAAAASGAALTVITATVKTRRSRR
jgi:uncharacterized membrane protein YeaQ/YmgE (transglycosylase-associated protein family)